MESRSYRILLVEDDEDDYVLTRMLLSEADGWKFDLHWVRNYSEAMKSIDAVCPDIMLVDYDLGAETGLDFVRDTLKKGYQIPAVMLTGRGNLEVDLEAMNAGATDYLVKGEISATMLERALRYAIGQQRAKNEISRAKDELEERVQERTRELRTANQELQKEISERRRVASELEELQQRLFDSIEAERLSLSQELHDGPMQEIYSYVYQLEVLKKKLLNADQAAVLGEIQAGLQQVNQNLRAIAGELRPPSLSPFGLEKSIRSHVDSFIQTHPEIEVICDLTPDHRQLPEGIRLALFRIYQQAMGNIVQHSSATRVQIRFTYSDSQARLEIEDNGQGFELPENWMELARTGHYGLVGARERVEGAGGDFEVESKPGQGTLIRAVLPISPRQNQH